MSTNLRFLQTPFWASFKEAHGWKSMHFTVEKDYSLKKAENYNDISADSFLTVLVRTFSIKLKKLSIAYIPMAPELTAGDYEDSSEYATNVLTLCQNLKKYLPKSTICIRFDFPADFSDFENRDKWTKQVLEVAKSRILHCPVAIQPPDTVLLSLDKSEEEILSAMKNKWRYNIRLAAKKGVKVESYRYGDENFEKMFDEFFTLFEQTSKRDGVNFHAKNYYLDLLKRGCNDNEKQPLITLYLAKHDEDYLAGIITLFCKREAVYLYGASGNIKRNFMPAYLLQWTAIKDAKSYGCPVYDFYGMPPTDDENHPMHGLYLFKTGFGGNIIHRPGSFDVVLNKFDYKLYIAAERARAFLFKKVLKKFKKK